MRYIIVAVIGIALLALLATAHDEWADERERLEYENKQLRKMLDDWMNK